MSLTSGCVRNFAGSGFGACLATTVAETARTATMIPRDSESIHDSLFDSRSRLRDIRRFDFRRARRQRVALSGIFVRQNGQSRVSTTTGAGPLSRLTCLTSRNTANATIRNSRQVLRKRPKFSVGAAGSPPWPPRATRRSAVQRDEKVAEVDASERHADRRHDQVVDDRRHDLAERGADDDADGEVDDVAAGGKVTEFLEHSTAPSDAAGSPTLRAAEAGWLRPTLSLSGYAKFVAPFADFLRLRVVDEKQTP